MLPSFSEAADPGTALLRERIRDVFRHLPKALGGEEESIHQMRVTGRRLRVALPLLAQKPDGRRLQSTLAILRQLTRAAGTSRDLDVCVSLFEEPLRANVTPMTPELLLLRRRLRGARSRSRSRMAEALMDIEIARLRRHLRRVVARGGESVFTVFLRLRDAREARGAAILAEFKTLGDGFEVEALHNLRKQTRRLRYTAELSDRIKERDTEAPGLFRELQEQLGHVHDTYVLALWLERQALAAGRDGQEALAGEGRRQQEFFLEESRRHHRVLLDRQPGKLVEQALEAMGQTRTAA